MPIPRLMTQVTKRLNKRILKTDDWPILSHVGRVSGTEHRTPIDAFPTEDGFFFTLNYGLESDWYRNVIAAGEAELEIKGERYRLFDLRTLTTEEAYPMMVEEKDLPPKFVGVHHCLVARAEPANG